ncbi:MAG: Rossmann fold domain-containing protein [Pseudomonadota bacterium]
MQRLLEVHALPDSGLDAAQAFLGLHLKAARSLLDAEDTTSLAIVLPPAGPDHADWRRAVARDMAREFSPKRVNVVGASEGAACEELLTYLGNAPGVTGQYCQTHE